MMDDLALMRLVGAELALRRATHQSLLIRHNARIGELERASARLRAALELARGYLVRRVEELLDSCCVRDAEGRPQRETCDAEFLEWIEATERDLAAIDAALDVASNRREARRRRAGARDLATIAAALDGAGDAGGQA